jgi:uncharacterized protein (DUF983 family)
MPGRVGTIILAIAAAHKRGARVAVRHPGGQEPGAEAVPVEFARMTGMPDRADRALPPPPHATPSFLSAVGRGLCNRCPVCGEGPVFGGFLRVVPECAVCGAPLGRLRADDAPPYVVIFLVGHLLVPVVFWVERAYEPPMWLHMAVWLPLFAVLCTLLLRPAKGAVVGYMTRMGFLDEEGEAADASRAESRAAGTVGKEDGRG